MSKYHDAAATLKRHAVKYEALMAAAKALDEVGSLDQAAKECEAQAKAAKLDLQAAQAELGASKADLAEHKDKVKTAKADAQAKIDALLQAAQDDAKLILSAANDTAAQIKAAVAQDIERLQKNEREKLNELRQENAALVQQINANADKFAAQTQTAEDLEKRIAKAQASIAKLLG